MHTPRQSKAQIEKLLNEQEHQRRLREMDELLNRAAERKRKPGKKRTLTQEKVESGIAVYRRMLAEDPSWAEQPEAAALKVIEELGFDVSWWTVKRRIIDEA